MKEKTFPLETHMWTAPLRVCVGMFSPNAATESKLACLEWKRDWGRSRWLVKFPNTLTESINLPKDFNQIHSVWTIATKCLNKRPVFESIRSDGVRYPHWYPHREYWMTEQDLEIIHSCEMCYLTFFTGKVLSWSFQILPNPWGMHSTNVSNVSEVY